MSMDDVEAPRLAIKVISIARLTFLLQIEGRLGIVLASDGQDRLQSTIDAGICGSKKLHLVPAPVQPPAEMIDNSLCAHVPVARLKG